VHSNKLLGEGIAELYGLVSFGHWIDLFLAACSGKSQSDSMVTKYKHKLAIVCFVSTRVQ